MSEYYKVEDVINTLADLWRFEQEMEYTDTAEDIEEWRKVARKLFVDLPIIEVSEDCISREELSEAILMILNYWHVSTRCFDEVKDFIKNAPSAVPTQTNAIQHTQSVESVESVEPTTEQSSILGEWIESEIPNELYVCSECGDACWSYDWDRTIVKSRYCPNCGAKMKGAGDE